jgi:hypothetical protein
MVYRKNMSRISKARGLHSRNVDLQVQDENQLISIEYMRLLGPLCRVLRLCLVDDISTYDTVPGDTPFAFWLLPTGYNCYTK